MSKSLKQEPSVRITQEQFDELMRRYSQLESGVMNDAAYKQGYTTVVDAKAEHDLLKEYGIETPYEPDEDGNYPEWRAETFGLRDIERLTCYNTFPYSKTAYMYATDEAVKSTKDLKTGQKSDVIEALKSELKTAESCWHEDTGVSFDEVKGKNVHKNDEHLHNMWLNQKRQSAIDFLGQISQYSGNQYVKMLYDFAVQYNDELYKKNQQQFSEKKEPVKIVTQEVKEQSKDEMSSSVVHVGPNDGKDPAFANYGKRVEPDIGVRQGRNGKFYGHDMSGGQSAQEPKAPTNSTRSYGKEIDRYLNESNDNKLPDLQAEAIELQ